MGVSTESRGGSVIATPRVGPADDRDMLPPMTHDQAFADLSTPRMALDGMDGRQEGPGLVEAQSSGGRGGRLRSQPYSSSYMANGAY